MTNDILERMLSVLRGERPESTATTPADPTAPNAVIIRTDGSAELTHLSDFVDSDILGAPIDCDRVNIVLNRLPDWSERVFGVRLCGYVNANGIPLGLDENETIESLSGYDYIAGDCVLVRVDSKYNYCPLTQREAEKIRDYFNH